MGGREGGRGDTLFPYAQRKPYVPRKLLIIHCLIKAKIKPCPNQCLLWIKSDGICVVSLK